MGIIVAFQMGDLSRHTEFCKKRKRPKTWERPAILSAQVQFLSAVHADQES
jgi:hypothetical protein